MNCSVTPVPKLATEDVDTGTVGIANMSDTRGKVAAEEVAAVWLGTAKPAVLVAVVAGKSGA
jgi:hypothetical protein